MASKMNTLKGQTFMIELIIMIVVTLFVMLTYLDLLRDINSYRSIDERHMFIVHDVANNLVLTRGYPADWDQYTSNESLIQSLGLISRRNVIDNTKLSMLNSTNFGYFTGIEKYNISIKIMQGIYTLYQAGTDDNSTTRILVERTCVYNNTPAIFRLAVTGG
jgi:hypothetical protein